MAHGVVCHFDLPHMAQKVADWTRREGRPRADEMAHGAVCRFELPHVAENNRRVTRVDSSLWPQRTVPKLPSGTNGCQTLKTATLNTSYFCQKRPLCQPPPSPTPPPNSHFVRKVKLRLAYRLAFARFWWMFLWKWRVRSQISGGLPGFLAWAKRTCQKDSGQRGKKSTQD